METLNFLGRIIDYFRQMSLGLQKQIRNIIVIAGMEKKFQDI